MLREERGTSWEQLQQSILGQLRVLLQAEVWAQVSWRGTPVSSPWGHVWSGLLALQL